MNYSSENKLPVMWLGGGALAYLSLGPVALAGVAVMWWSRKCHTEAVSKGWITPETATALPPAPNVTAALPAAVGHQTRLTAVNVAFTPSPEPAPQPAPTPVPVPTPTPPVTINASPEIHNHLSPPASERPIPKNASPPQSDRQTEAPDLSLYADPTERMTVLLKAMAKSGFPLGKLLKHPFVWCYGRSQSGKTTIAMMLSAARIAMGNRIEYLSTDEDVEPLAWAAVSLGSDYYSTGVDRVTELMNRSVKRGLAGQGWVFDEMLAAAGQYKIDITRLLTAVLMKGSKTKGLIIGISQADTSGAHGLKGIDAAWREERISVEAIPTEDDLGERAPSGRYIITQGNDSEEWTLPEWMLTELNKYGGPCPVVWMLKHFPELRGQVLGAGQQETHPTETAGSLAPASTQHPAPSTQHLVLGQHPAEPPSAEDWVVGYLKKRADRGALVGDLLSSKAPAISGFDAISLREHLEDMAERNLILLDGKRFYHV